MSKSIVRAGAWSPLKRVGFRLVFVYVVLYLLPFPAGTVPGTGLLAMAYQLPWAVLVPWVGRSVLGLTQEMAISSTGSGDRAYHYVHVLCVLAIAVVAAALWTILGRGRTEYGRLHVGLRAYVRLALGSTLIMYGAFKVIKSQFAFPLLHQLVQPLGEASPMGLLWRFMGYSLPYNVFVGAGEMLAGVLLFSRRTSTLGALLSAAVLSHVAVLNFCYDVPVKLFSAHLLGLAVFLLLPDLGRLWDFFLANRPTAPAPLPSVFARPAWNGSAFVLRGVLFCAVLGSSLSRSWQQARAYGDLAPRPPLWGLYEVERFERDGQVHPPLLTDGGRWRYLAIDRPLFLAAVLMDGSVRYYDWSLDPTRRTVALQSRDRVPQRSELRYTETPSGGLVLEGQLDGAPFQVALRRTDTSRHPLLSRRFHWVNEYPFNR